MSKLDTQNLTLKVRCLADVDALLKLFSGDRDAIVKSVFVSDTHWRKNGFGTWSIFHKDELVGSLTLRRLADARVGFEVEIGEKFRKKGFAKEAATAVLSFGFRLHKIPEIFATVKSLNTSGRKLLESLQFTQRETAGDDVTFSLAPPLKK